MKCPECVKEDKKSIVKEDAYSGTRTLLYCSPYYDEDGNYHHHDYNYTRYNLICSNGHKWSEKSYGSCHCGWTNDPKEEPND